MSNHQRKLPLLVAGVLLQILAFSVWDFLYLNYALEHYRTTVYETLARETLVQIKDIRAATATPKTNLANVLKEFQDNGRIGFSIVDQGRAPASVSVEGIDPNQFDKTSDGTFRIWKDQNTGKDVGLYVTEKIADNVVTFGMYVDQHYIARNTEFNRGHFWINLFARVLLALWVLAFTYRDLIQFFRKIQWGGILQPAAANGALKGRFRETAAIAQVFNHAQRQLDSTTTELERARLQILPGYLSELKDTQARPYQFTAYLVRIDINGSTKAYSDPKLKSVQDEWFNKFFLQASEIVNRYGGYCHEVIGDELIFYVKRTAGMSEDLTAVLTLSCIRDIGKMAEQIDKQVFAEFNFHFTVKCSVDKGEMHVADGYRGLRISGLPPRNVLVTTGRMLEFVHDKSKNRVVVPESIARVCEILIKKAVSIETKIPDMPDETHYMIVEDFHEHLEHSDALLYRTDADLQLIMQQIQNAEQEREAIAGIAILRSATVRLASEGFAQVVVHTLYCLQLQKTWVKALSAMTGAIPTLLPKHQVPPKLEGMLLELVQNEDSRVQANAIAAWRQLNFDVEALVEHFGKVKHHRGLGNIIATILCHGLDSKYLRMARKMLSSSDVFVCAAGCYAVGQLVTHYKNTDPLVLTTNPMVQGLIDQLRVLVTHQNEMVRRQSQRALAAYDRA